MRIAGSCSMSSGSFFRTAVTRERLYRRRSRRTSECSVGVSSPAVAWRLALAASRRRSVGSESPTVPAAKAGRRTAALRLQGLEIEREGLAGAGGDRLKAVAAAECREVGPVLGA